MLYKILLKLIDIDFDNCLNLNKSRALRTTYLQQAKHVENVCTKICFNSFCMFFTLVVFYKTVSAWNNLPDNIVNQSGLTSFNKVYRPNAHLLDIVMHYCIMVILCNFTILL